MSRKKLVSALVAVVLGFAVVGCSSDAEVASENLSKDADNFKINRKIVFYNGITGQDFLIVEGFCSIDPGDQNRMTVTCKTGEKEFKKHFLGKSDNVTWFAEQIDGANVSVSNYKVIFKPSTVIPDVERR